MIMKTRKNAKSLLSLLAALTILATLSGCGDDSSSSSKSDSGSSSSASDTDSSKADDSAKKEDSSKDDSDKDDSSKADDSSKSDDSAKDDSSKADDSSKKDDSSKSDSSQAASKPQVATDAKKADTGTTGYANSRAKKLAQSMTSDKMTIDASMDMDMMGTKIQEKIYMTYDTSGKGKMYMDMNMDGAGETINVTVIILDGTCYAVNHTDKTYVKTPTTDEANVKTMVDTFNMTEMLSTDDGKDPKFEETGKATMDGKACVYEVFSDPSSDDGTLMYYYFDEKSGELVKLVGHDPKTNTDVAVIDELSNTIHTEKIKVPDLKGYTEDTSASADGALTLQ